MAKTPFEKAKSAAVSKNRGAKLHLRSDYDGANVSMTAVCGRTRTVRTIVRFGTLVEFEAKAAEEEMFICATCQTGKNNRVAGE